MKKTVVSYQHSKDVKHILCCTKTSLKVEIPGLDFRVPVIILHTPLLQDSSDVTFFIDPYKLNILAVLH